MDCSADIGHTFWVVQEVHGRIMTTGYKALTNMVLAETNMLMKRKQSKEVSKTLIGKICANFKVPNNSGDRNTFRYK